MNYYKPLELSKDGKPSGIFHFTRTNDGHSSPEGYCATKNCQHKTPEEASDCYRDYIVNERKSMLPGGFPAGPHYTEPEHRGTIIEIASSY